MVITSFKSFEDMMASLESARTTADGRVTPTQSGIVPGDFVVIDHGDLQVFAHILPPDFGSGSLEDSMTCMELYSQPHMRNYRFTRAYSVMCPEGELGDIHVSTVAYKISKQEFDAFVASL